eukprot:gnl/Spiro4/15788_TR8492_c0_g1_i1.p1 gnl/Spiro4/15788_TR8492_c0_g1~~gnl/Spiro4/15788_TR8492_c0_g1_i1.p1  ORF type:complete len:264 (-),score=52.44 gnl/Spiro4/15788_TR8492_c0_g1_i1:94-885(-)
MESLFALQNAQLKQLQDQKAEVRQLRARLKRDEENLASLYARFMRKYNRPFQEMQLEIVETDSELRKTNREIEAQHTLSSSLKMCLEDRVATLEANRTKYQLERERIAKLNAKLRNYIVESEEARAEGTLKAKKDTLALSLQSLEKLDAANAQVNQRIYQQLLELQQRQTSVLLEREMMKKDLAGIEAQKDQMSKDVHRLHGEYRATVEKAKKRIADSLEERSALFASGQGIELELRLHSSRISALSAEVRACEQKISTLENC